MLLGERVDPMQRARLLGAADIIDQASSLPMGVWERLLVEPHATRLREHMQDGELSDVQAAYRDGRSLSFGEAASLAQLLVEDATQTPG